MTTINVLVYGGRDFTWEENVFEWLDYIFADWDDDEVVVISGMARGADTLGLEWAKRRGMRTLMFPANWKMNGKVAGFIRNQQMLEEGKPDYAVEFPGGNGTAHMRGLLDKAGVEVFEYAGGKE